MHHARAAHKSAISKGIFNTVIYEPLCRKIICVQLSLIKCVYARGTDESLIEVSAQSELSSL